ncbi:unnamed protein product, partial [Brassica rapa]
FSLHDSHLSLFQRDFERLFIRLSEDFSEAFLESLLRSLLRKSSNAFYARRLPIKSSGSLPKSYA